MKNNKIIIASLLAFASLPVVANAGMVTVQQDVVTEKIEGIEEVKRRKLTGGSC